MYPFFCNLQAPPRKLQKKLRVISITEGAIVMNRNEQNYLRVFVFVLFAILLTGCANGNPTEQGQIPAPQTGETPETSEQATAQTEQAFDPASLPDEVAHLVGLPVDAFFDESFKFLILRDPEWVATEGLEDYFGGPGDQLTDISDAYLRETQVYVAAVYDLLHTYDRESLTPEQQISYDVYEWYLDDLIRGYEFMYYDYPITHFTTGVQNQMIYFFTDFYTIEDQEDAENYIARLSQVDTKFEGLIEGLEKREEAGIVSPRFIIQWSMGGIYDIARSSPRMTPFYGAFEEKVISLEGVNDANKKALLEEAETAIGESVIPAYQALAAYLEYLQTVAPSNDGVWQFPKGEEYYAYVMRHFSTSDLTLDEVYNLGYEELERIHAEMRAVFKGLGYPVEGVGLPDLFDRVAAESGVIRGSEVAQTYEALLQEADQNLDRAFDLRPEAELVVYAGPVGDFYVSASLDGSRPGAFYAQVGGDGQDYYAMPTLAYHEGIPGHHFQISIAQESDLPLFRNIIGFLGYAEGWALYSERLAYDLGWYDDDPYGNLGRLQAEAFRAARLVIDTAIHTRGWTYDQAHEFMVENTGFDQGDNVSVDFEISRYIAWPGQATAYKIGMIKMLELRQKAIDRLGEHFDITEFHNIILSNGSMPLEVLERVVDGYIESKLAEVEAETNALLDDLAEADGLIVFSSYRLGESEIFTMNPDGSNVTRVTYSDDRESRPVWSSDRSEIAYVARIGTNYNYEIFRIKPDGSGIEKMTHNPESFESEPAWSPDGSQVAFISNRPLVENTFDARFNTYIMNADGGDQRLLTDIGGSNSSPDGSLIAFQSTRDENYEIYVIKPDGSDPINLSQHPANDHSPTWSPDGSKIAFVSDRDGNEEIYVMNADGSNTTRLTHIPGYDKGPSWSPDGRFIVFYGNRRLNAEIYVVRADGSAQVRLTHQTDFDGFPDWQP
jgi:uncharacterized protein (DUF885 family)/Tol biopolymer transport system component